MNNNAQSYVWFNIGFSDDLDVKVRAYCGVLMSHLLFISVLELGPW